MRPTFCSDTSPSAVGREAFRPVRSRGLPNLVDLVGLTLVAALFVPGPWLTSAARAASFELALEEVVSGIVRPVGLTHAGDGSGRLFVVQQTGRILVVDGGVLRPEPFLEVAVSCCGEQGLLGLAFHPDYETNGLFYVDYVDGQGDTVVSRFRVSADNPNRADPASEVVILALDQPDEFTNHNGGQLAFGPDGYLYVALGDGGGGDDPLGNGQNPQTLFGTVLRLDVDAPGVPYAVPPDNPFVGDPNALDEIFVYGLRNPWRFSFDRQTGDLFIADVGKKDWEEVDFVPAGSPGGQNFGWNVTEGNECYPPGATCDPSPFTLPILTYSHALGCAVAGGYRYRGPASAMDEVYVYGDYCAGRIWAATPSCGGGWRSEELVDHDFRISSFGEDEAGRLYVLEFDVTDGAVHRLVAVPTPGLLGDGFESGDLTAWMGCDGLP